MVFKTNAEKLAEQAQAPAVEQAQPAVAVAQEPQEPKLTPADKRTRLNQSKKKTEIELLDLNCKHQKALGALAMTQDYARDAKIVDDLASKIAAAEGRLASFETVSQGIADEIKAQREAKKLAEIEALKADVRRGLDRRLTKDAVDLDQAFDRVLEVLERYASNGEWTSEKARQAAFSIPDPSGFAYADFCILAMPRTAGHGAYTTAALTSKIQQIVDLFGGTSLRDAVEVNPYSAKHPSDFVSAAKLDIQTLSPFFAEAKA